MCHRRCVYFARAANGLVKIGHTTNVTMRLHYLFLEDKARGRLELLHRVETDSGRWLELLLHHLFREKRVEGEWFRLTEEDLAAVRRLDRVDTGGPNGWGPSQPDWLDRLRLPERLRLVEAFGLRVFLPRPGPVTTPGNRYRPPRQEQPLLPWQD